MENIPNPNRIFTHRLMGKNYQYRTLNTSRLFLSWFLICRMPRQPLPRQCIGLYGPSPYWLDLFWPSQAFSWAAAVAAMAGLRGGLLGAVALGRSISDRLRAVAGGSLCASPHVPLEMAEQRRSNSTWGGSNDELVECSADETSKSRGTSTYGNGSISSQGRSVPVRLPLQRTMNRERESMCVRDRTSTHTHLSQYCALMLACQKPP